jgi:DNA-binding transcriptional regulator PaaX
MQRPPLTKVLLSLLAGTAGVMVDYCALLHALRYHRGTYLHGGLDAVRELARLRGKRDARNALRQLQASSYVKARVIGTRLMVTLTAKGRATALAARLRSAPKRADGLATVVVFDVPQSQNTARRRFRLLLRQGEFVKLQQSVWVSRRDTYALLREFIREAKLVAWVTVFRANDFFPPLR